MHNNLSKNQNEKSFSTHKIISAQNKPLRLHCGSGGLTSLAALCWRCHQSLVQHLRDRVLVRDVALRHGVVRLLVLSGGLKLEVIVVFIGREEEAWLEEVIVHPVFVWRGQNRSGNRSCRFQRIPLPSVEKFGSRLSHGLFFLHTLWRILDPLLSVRTC